MLDYLRSVCPDVRTVRGAFDDAALASAWPDTALLTLGGLRIGLTHGHALVPWGDPAAAAGLARRLGADVLVAGHSHALRAAVSLEGVLHVDPGSATGAAPAFPGGSARGATAAVATPGEPSTPSFVLMDVSDGRATVYTYRLVDGATPDAPKVVKVEKLAYVKGQAPPAEAAGGGAAPAAPAPEPAPAAPAPPPAA